MYCNCISRNIKKGVLLEANKKGVPREAGTSFDRDLREAGTSFDTDISFSGSPFNMRQSIEDKKLPEASKKGVPSEAGTSFDTICFFVKNFRLRDVFLRMFLLREELPQKKYCWRIHKK